MTATKIKLSTKSDTNLETFSLLWLDAEVNTTEDNKNAQKRLRTIINHLRIFHDPNECKSHIKSCSEQDRIVLIISGRLSKELIPEIHGLRQLSSIYIYCFSKKEYKRWAKDFSKIKAVVTDLEDLIRKIKSDQKDRGKTEEPMSLNIYQKNTKTDKSTSDLNESNDTDKKKLVEFCKDEYSDNDEQLEIIREFDRDYKSRKAIWWYSRDTFLYRMLNKALRIQNSEVLLLFRFVIRDIYKQLEKNKCQNRVCVYRYQKMFEDELENLQNSVGQFISINSFFSTTANRDIAINFSNHSAGAKDLFGVLFIIEADPSAVKSKPFADVSMLSYFSNESEILFMVGCIFRVTSVQRDEKEHLWIIQMHLAGDDDNDLETLFEHLKQDYGGGENEVGLQCYGDILQYMGKYDAAEKIYSGLREKCSSDDHSYSCLCFSFGMLYKDMKDYNRSLRWFQTALERKIRADPTDFLYIAGLHCSMGNIYFEKCNYDEAMKSYNKSMDIYRRGNNTSHPDLASLYHGVARIYLVQKKYSDAFNFFQQSLSLQEKNLPSNHPDMALNYSAMGDVFRAAGQYQRAMYNYTRAIEIRNKSLPPEHPDIALTNKNIGQLYEAASKWKESATYYQIAKTIYSKTMSSQHPDVIAIDQDIQRVTSKLK